MRKTINRITVLVLALILTFTTIYDNSVKVEASSVVIGGAVVGGDALIDFLIGLALVGICGVLGSQAEQSDIQYVRDQMNDFLSTEIGSSAFKDYADKSSITDIHDLSVEQALSTTVSGLDMTAELNTFLSLFYDYLEDSGEFADLDKGVYSQYSVFPENWYIGYNSSIVPDPVLSADNYNINAAHVQIYSSSESKYLDLQEIGTYVYSSYPSTRSDGYFDCMCYHVAPYYGINRHWLTGGTVTFSNGVASLNYNVAQNTWTYVYDMAYSTLNFAQGGYWSNLNISDSDEFYLYPSVTMPFVFESNGNIYVLTPDGLYDVLSMDTPIAASKVVTGADAKPTLKSLVGSVSGFWDRVGDKVISGSDTADQPKTYSKDAINSIYNNVAKYYDQTVENYYNDTSYITGDTYVENVTNIYNESVVDYPVPAVPDVELGSIGQYTVTGLSDVFPFCIPFDMYDLMSILCADPHAISFDVTIDFGYFGEHTISIDLSLFDPVAKIFRTMELLLYAFGLMFWTRSLIRG